ncbi:hypothetical protein KIW84_MT0052 (mitochondrion) [Lathyrus oleraceus]|nr:hypothetical protein KIW84_MT0052 [Pisum sativum]
MAERLGDLCFDTLREEIKKQIEGLLQIYFHNALVLPPGKRIQDIATHLHHDSESLEQLLTILKNLTELGLQSIRGILLNRRNIPIMSMPIESMLLAVNSNFLVFSVSSDDMMGQSFASLVSTVAAAESAIGLAIFVITFRVRGTIAVEFINSIQGFIIFSRKSLGNTFKVTLDGRIQAIQEESQQFPNPNEVVPPESNEQQRLLRISLRICGTVVESLPMARCAPKCEKTVQALLCRNLNVKSATLPNATSSRRIRLQDDLGTKFHLLVRRRFIPQCISKAEKIELIRESLVVLRMVRGRPHALRVVERIALRKTPAVAVRFSLKAAQAISLKKSKQARQDKARKLRRKSSCSNRAVKSVCGKALQSEVLRLGEEMFLVDAGPGTPRNCMQDEPTGVPINRATRFENKVGFLDLVAGESLIKKKILERLFIDLVAGESLIKERAAARFNDLVGSTDVVAGEPLLLLPRRFRQNRAWMKLNKIWRTNTKVKGFIIDKVKGGYSVAIAGFITFLPFRSHNKRKKRRISNDRFTIESINPKRTNIVVF